MDDPELEAIRQKRMQELMAAQGGGGGMDPEAQAQKADQQRAQEEQRANMLASVLSPQARERLARIALVKPDKARKVEDMVIGMAQKGKIQERVSEDQLIHWLEQINEQTQTKTKVQICRRRSAFDDEDDD
ncbi:hypothetical protein CYMTET_47028 [Cymbomonas tetramitiformis]|uniref:Programmed cell death protein 5 n=1 Tax=Cymbomonas tetramitiformis TaxID=36881 RepID=A0AAE0EX12_9CHLO|nr:hypothetical protein CYMTET_47028 [Cymbomonas tetramitiformis]